MNNIMGMEIRFNRVLPLKYKKFNMFDMLPPPPYSREAVEEFMKNVVIDIIPFDIDLWQIDLEEIKLCYQEQNS